MKNIIVTTPMPWPLFQITIRKTLNYYSINQYIHISYSRFLPTIHEKVRLPRFNDIFLTLLDGIGLLNRFLYLFICLDSNKNLEHRINLIKKIGNLSFKGCQYGDLLLSKHLRSPFSNGTISLSLGIFSTLKSIFLIPFIYLFTRYYFNLLSLNNKEFRLILIIPEIVRLSQFLRRVIYKLANEKDIEINELCFNVQKDQYEINKFSDPFDFVLSTKSIKKLKIDERVINESWDKLNLRLFSDKHEHAHTANLYKEFDIDTNAVLDKELKNFLSTNQPILFLPLHQSADSQFEWGFDEFGDIDTFSSSIIEFCISRNYKLIIKPHPMGFSNTNRIKYKIEKRFYKKLFYKYFFKNFNKSNISNKSIISKIYPNLIWIPCKYPLTKIYDESNSKFLTLTRHGNIVIESFAANIPCTSCLRSRYYNFEMPNTFEKLSELKDIISLFMNDTSSAKLLPIDQIRYLSACAIVQRKLGFNIKSDNIVEDFFPGLNLTTASVEKMRYIHAKLKISKFKSFKSTEKIKDSQLNFEEIIKELLENKND